MRITLRSLLVAALVMTSGSALAQTTEVQSASPAAAIPDDGYIGSLDGNDGTGADAGMACTTLTFSSGIAAITDVSMDIGITHSWLGDVTVKVKSPEGTVVAPMVRPAGDATNPPADDGSGCCGDSTNLDGASPLNFADDNAADAETMGLGLGTSDVASGPFVGNGDVSANSGLFASFAGESADGEWEVCVGDAAGGDLGTFDTVTLTVSGSGGGSCPIDFTATVNTTTVNPGDVLTFSVSATNTGGSASTAALVLNASGPASISKSLGSGTLPAGATITRDINVRVPGSAPGGTYNVSLDLSADGNPCASETFEITVNAPRVADAPAMTKAESLALEGTHVAPAAVVPFVVESGNVFAQASAQASGVSVSPNPFARQAQVTFEVAASAPVRLAVYDVLGREVAVLVDGPVEAGTHVATFDAAGLAAGTYVYRLVVGSDVQTGRMTLAH